MKRKKLLLDRILDTELKITCHTWINSSLITFYNFYSQKHAFVLIYLY